MAPVIQQSDLMLKARARRRRAEAEGGSAPAMRASDLYGASEFGSSSRKIEELQAPSAPAPTVTSPAYRPLKPDENVLDYDYQVNERPMLQAARGQTQEMLNATPNGGGEYFVLPDAPQTRAGYDFKKGMATLPVDVANAVPDTAENIYNLPGAVVNAVRPGTLKPADFPEIPVPESLKSQTGATVRALAPWMMTRGVLSKIAPGGGAAGEITKDLATSFGSTPGDLTERTKAAADMALMSAPMHAVSAVAGAKPAAPRPQPSVTSVPPTRPAQPPGGVQPPPVINAVPAGSAPSAITKGQARVARDTARITARIMRSARIKDADIAGYLPGAIQRFKSLNDERMFLAPFLKRDIREHFPEAIADEVATKLDTWGRARNAETGPQDTGRRTIQKTIKTLRGSQQDFLTESAKRNLYKGSLIGQEDAIIKSLRETGKKGYEPVLQHARDAMEGRRVPTAGERQGFEELRQVLNRPVFRDRIPNDVRMTAEAEGLDLQELIERDPVTAAHWLQSNLRQLEDAAEDLGGKATPASLAYGRMRDDVLVPLKKAAPGYEGALNRYGHDFGAKGAVRFGRGFFTTARSAYDTAKMVRRFKALGSRQQTVAWKSIREEFLNEFRGTPEEAAAKVTRMQQEGTLDALEQLGVRGKRFASDIRKIAQDENAELRAIEQASGSPTHSNIEGAKAAKAMVQSPVNKAVGALGDEASWTNAAVADAVLLASHLPPVVTIGKVGSKLVNKLGNPSRKVLSRATEGLYGLPAKAQTNGLVGPPKTPRISGPKAATPEGPQDLGTLLRQLDEAERDAKTRGGPEGKRLLNQIAAERKRLEAAQPANGLKTTSPPRAPLPPSQGGSGANRGPNKNGLQSNMPPEILTVPGGAILGNQLAPDNQKGPGTVLGALGGFAGGRMVRDFGKAFEGAPRSTPSVRKWSTSDYNAALRRFDQLKQELESAKPSDWAAIESEMGELRRVLGIKAPMPEVSPSANPRMAAVSKDDPFGDRAWQAQKKGLTPSEPQEEIISEFTPADYQAMRNQLRELRAERRTAKPEYRAEIDQEIAGLEKALEVEPKTPPDKSGFGFGSRQPLPMDEGARMERAREQGFDVEQPWWHSGRANEDFNADSGELGMHLGDQRAAFHVDNNARNRRAGHQVRKFFVRGDFAETPDLGDFSSPAGYYTARHVKPTEFDPRYEKMWQELDRAVDSFSDVAGPAEMTYIKNKWRATVHDAAKRYNISGWEYPNTIESNGAPSRVVFFGDKVRGAQAAFDPSQQSSSRILDGFGADEGEGIVSRVVGPAAVGSTISSFGPEGESYDKKLPRMLLGALAAVGVRNIDKIRSFLRNPEAKAFDAESKRIHDQILAYQQKGVQAAKWRDEGWSDEVIAARLGLFNKGMDGERMTPADIKHEIDGVIKAGREWQAPDAGPPPEQMGSGRPHTRNSPAPPVPKGPPKGANGLKRPILAPMVIAELNRASKVLPPDVRNKLAENSALPPSMRKSAVEAVGDDPSIYSVAAPFQRTKNGLLNLSRQPNPVETGIRGRLENLGRQRSPTIEPLAETAGLAEKRRRAAVSEAQRTANKLNPYYREAQGLPDQPLPKSIERNEQQTTEMAIAARKALAAAKLEATSQADVQAWAAQRKAEIADALSGQGPSIRPPGATATGIQPGVAGKPIPGRPMKPVSRREAEDMSNLLFDKANAQMLDDILSGRVKPRSRDDYHMALLWALGIGAGVSIPFQLNAMGNARAPGSPPQKSAAPEPPNPRYIEDPMRNSQDPRRAKEAQTMLGVIFGRDLKPDGIFIRKDGIESSSQRYLKRFQWEHQDDYGLEVTGLLDDKTIDALGQEYRKALATRNGSATGTRNGLRLPSGTRQLERAATQ